MLKSWGVVMVVGGLEQFSVSPRPLGTNLGFELGWTWFGFGLGGSGNKGLGPGLDKRGILTLGCL